MVPQHLLSGTWGDSPMDVSQAAPDPFLPLPILLPRVLTSPELKIWRI